MTASEARVLSPLELAASLGKREDRLGRDARASLESAEAPERLSCWSSSRAELLATYEVRLSRADVGEGPWTEGLRDYTEVLRLTHTPQIVEEVGWGIRDTFYVVLLNGSEVLAVTTVARAVWVLERPELSPEEVQNAASLVIAFGIGDGFNDETLIKNALDHPCWGELGLNPAHVASTAIDRETRRLTVTVSTGV